MLTINKSDELSPSLTKPQIALIIHGADGDKGNVDYVTRHPIKNGLIQQGKYISPSKVIEHLQNNTQSSLTYQSPRIIAESAETLVWYHKSVMADMWFKIKGKSHQLRVKWSALLFVANKTKKSLQVFALDKDQYPNEHDPIYHAPIMNVGSDGTVCQGTAKLPDTIDSSTIKEMEDTIYNSCFTHVNHQQTLKIDKSVPNHLHFKFWKKRDGIERKIPKTMLVKYSTLSRLFETLK